MELNLLELTRYIAPFLPFLMNIGNKAVEGIATKLGENSFEKAKAIWAKLQPKIQQKEAALEAATDLATSPNDHRLQEVLCWQLKKLLEKDETLKKEIAQIMQMQDVQEAGSNSIKINSSGDNNNIIGVVNGDANFGKG